MKWNGVYAGEGRGEPREVGLGGGAVAGDGAGCGSVSRAGRGDKGWASGAGCPAIGMEAGRGAGPASRAGRGGGVGCSAWRATPEEIQKAAPKENQQATRSSNPLVSCGHKVE